MRQKLDDKEKIEILASYLMELKAKANGQSFEIDYQELTDRINANEIIQAQELEN